MRGRLRVLVAVGVLFGAPVARAAVLRVQAAAAGDTAHTAAAAVARALPGDTVVLAAGVHRGPLRIARPIVLRGEPGGVVEGGGRGTVIEVGASGVRIERLEVRGSG